MDSLANWAGVGALSASMASLGNVDRNLDFTSYSNVGLNPVKPPNLECGGRSLELNGVASQSDWMKLMGLSAADPDSEGDRARLMTPATSADEEFGHWRPVYDKNTRPMFSLTGTEIWAAQKPGSAQKEKTTSDWNLTDTTKSSAAAITAMESVKSLLRDEEAGLENARTAREAREGIWRRSSVQSSGSSSMDFGSSVASNMDSSAGWGSTPICQDKPWDLHQDCAVMETIAGLQLRAHQDFQKPRDAAQDCSTDLWRNSLMSGEPLGGMINQTARGLNGRSLELFTKSDASDDVALQLELQKLAVMEGHSPDGLLSQSRRGSSVSSIDGLSLSSVGGRVDRRELGIEPNNETLSWMDKQRKLSSQKDEWSHGNPSLQLYSGLQSPSGWSSLSGSEKTPPAVDNGTAVWSKTASQEKVADDTTAWVKMLRTPSFPPPPSVFDIDVSVPPPPLNAPPVLPLGAVTPAPPGLNIPPMLNNLQPSSNLTARKLSSPHSYMTRTGGLASPSADISEKPWPYLQQQQQLQQQQPVERQRLWTGNQWINSDQWNNMQRKGTSTVFNKAPQTRSRLIQQLVSMGFKKEDAQNALITYNMDLKKALAELITKQSMMTSSSFFEPRLNSMVGGGQVPQTTDNVKDVLRSSLGVPPGHMMGVGGSGLPDAPLDFSQLISSSTGWDMLMQTPSSSIQMLQSGRNPLAAGLISPMPPPLLHSSLQLPTSIHSSASGQDVARGVNQDDLRQLSDLALCRSLAESSRNSLHPDAELLQLFAKTLSASNPGVSSHDSAIYPPGSGVPAGRKLPDHLGSSIQSGLMGTGPGHSSSVEPKAVTAQQGPDRYGLPPSLTGRQFSLNLALSTHEEATVDQNRSEASNSLQSLASGSKTNQSDLQKLTPKLEIKEFIPGVPWKGAQGAADQMPAMSTVASAFKDITTEWLTKNKETVVHDDSVQKCLPSKWLELSNLSDQLNDMKLHCLCTRYGQVKVFTRQADGSLLVSYVNLEDAINAQAALNQYELNGVPITAEFVKDWTVTDTGADTLTTTDESESLGYTTPDGLWIPPDADMEPAYYDITDAWCEGYDATQLDEHWNDEAAFDPVTSTAYEDPDSQKQ